MSEIIRLSQRLAVPPLPVPYRRLDAHAEGVEMPTVVDGQPMGRGADEDEVANAAARHLARFEDAHKRYLAVKERESARGPTVAEYRAQKEFDDMSDLVRRFATEAGPDGSGAVTADMATALASLDQPVLAMVLRRAGNPPLFQPLLGADLGDVPLLGEGDQLAGKVESRAEARGAADAASVESLPMIMRPSSHFNKPGGESDSYKQFKPKDHDPMKMDTTRFIKDKKTGELRPFDAVADKGREGAVVYAGGGTEKQGYSPRTIKRLQNSMAGDQIAQARTMKASGDRLTIGAGESGDAPWNTAPGRRDSGQPIDRVVAKRNRGSFVKLQEALERASFAFDKDGAEISAEGTVNLDARFPRWRARVAEMDDAGKLAYPPRLPSAEYVTGMILGLHNFTEPGLFERWLPAVRRSINAAPDTPSTKEALDYSQKVLLPSKSFKEAMASGVGSADYPYKIYGPRKVDLPAVDDPGAAPSAPPKTSVEAQNAKTRERLERINKSRSKPEKTDQSSIYTVPADSPMSGLLA